MMYLVYKVTHDGRQDTILASSEKHALRLAKEKGYNVTRIEYGVAQNNITKSKPYKNRPDSYTVKDAIKEYLKE